MRERHLGQTCARKCRSRNVDIAGRAGSPTLDGVRPTPFGVYVHVPFCAARCGYCDFNTYTASELAGSGASPDGWLAAVRRELERAAATVGPRAVDTVFVGGGTPSLLGADRLATVLDAVRQTFGLAPDAEVTTESNPESTSPEFFARPGRGRLHPGLAGHAVGRAARAGRARPPAHPRPRRRGGRGRRGPRDSRTSTWT